GVLHRKVLLWRGSIPRAADDGLLDDAFLTRLRIDLDLLLGDVLLDDVELDASVLLTTLFGVVARDGVVRAEALRREHLLGDALGDEISTDRLGAVVRERPVEIGVPLRAGVPLDRDLLD